MIPIDARELMQKDNAYSNPFSQGSNAAKVRQMKQSTIPPPLIMADVNESEDSFYMEQMQDPLNRSEGEIGGDVYMQNLKNTTSFRQPEAGMAKSS